MNIRILPHEHVAIFGRTGSGKTYRALSFLDYVPRWLIVDPKWGIDASRWPRGTVKTVYKFNPKLDRQILRAPMGLIGDPDGGEYDHYQREILRAFMTPGERVIYADEVADISKSTQRMSLGYNRVLRLGRGRNVTGWSGTQRPSFIPAVVYTESTHFFVFELLSENDRKKVASFTDDRIRPLFKELKEYECIYWSTKSPAPRIIPANAIDISSVRTHTNTGSTRTFSWPSWLRRS
ncbi:MAG: hypothetical protein ACTHMJ_06450 [Thermomicrobiales bacterium]